MIDISSGFGDMDGYGVQVKVPAILILHFQDFRRTSAVSALNSSRPLSPLELLPLFLIFYRVVWPNSITTFSTNLIGTRNHISNGASASNSNPSSPSLFLTGSSFALSNFAIPNSGKLYLSRPPICRYLPGLAG